MIDHVSLGGRDLVLSRRFYRSVLEPLGYQLLVERDGMAGFGKRYPEIWLNARPGQAPIDPDTGHHVCLRARSPGAAAAVPAAALAAGGQDGGAPGPRDGAQVTYYGPFIFDPDGNKVEALKVQATSEEA